MSRPLVISDCDEVLLHMVRHFKDWLGEAHGVEFSLAGNPFAQSMRRRNSEDAMTQGEVFGLLEDFFHAEMGRQTEIAGAAAAIAELQKDADVVILTNLGDHFNEARRRQLAEHGISARVFTNQGPKGAALDRIVAEYGPTRAVFIDDLAHHHMSVAGIRPEVARLHFCGEPTIAPHIDCAHRSGHADARIDSWAEALPWLVETLHGEPR